MTANLVDKFEELYSLEASAFERVRGVHGTPSNGDVPTWVTANSRLEYAAGGGGGGSSTLAGDTDVAISSPADRNLLIYHSSDSKWHNDTLVAGDIPSLDASKITTGALAMARGGTGVDLSASGGTTKILAQDASHVISARDLVAADIPSLDASKITTGQLAAAQGGTGLDASAAANGKTLIGNGSGFSLAALTAGSGITITNSAGGITIAASGGVGPGGSVPYWVAKSPFTTGTAGAKDEFWDDTSNMSGPINGLDSSWTQSTRSALVERVFSGGMLHVTVSNAFATNAWIIYKSAPSTPWTITCPVFPSAYTNYNPCGVMARSSGSGQWVSMAVLLNAASPNDFEYQWERYASTSSRTSFSSASGNKAGGHRWHWLRLAYDGTTFTYSYSMTGVSQWVQFGTEAKSTFFGSNTIDGIGLYLDTLATNSPWYAALFGPFIVT